MRLVFFTNVIYLIQPKAGPVKMSIRLWIASLLPLSQQRFTFELQYSKIMAHNCCRGQYKYETKDLL